MKRPKLVAALLALALAAGSAWAQVRSAEEFDKEAREYKDYWFAASQKFEKDKDFKAYLNAIDKFMRAHQGCLLARVDMIQGLFQINDKQAQKLAYQDYLQAYLLVPTIPDSQEGKFSKAKYFRLASEITLYVEGSESAAQNFADRCAQNDETLGAQAYYNLANYYQRAGKAAETAAFYKKAFACNKELALAQPGDIKAFCAACDAVKKYDDLAAFYDQYISSSKTFFYPGFGAEAMSAYEKAKQKDKAALVAVFEQERALLDSDEGSEKFVALLKKHYGKDKAAKPCVAFVQKFYDKDAALSQADLDALPKGVRDFLPVRYMFKVKNCGDKKAAAQIKENMLGERFRR